MTILVVAEHNHSELNAITATTVTAASQIGGDVHVLIAGKGCNAAAKMASELVGVSKVIVADDPVYSEYLAENLAALVVANANEYSHILAPATTFGKDFAPRVAALLDIPQVSDVTEVVSANSFTHPIYAGNAMETVEVSSSKMVLTVRSTAFEKAASGGSAAVEPIAAADDAGVSSFVSKQESKGDRPDLATADIVVSGGRGLGSQENFKLIYDFADKLGAAVGASRAAVDAGYIPNDHQVGQTGKVVAPSLYIAVGVSGAIQHLAGMKDSKVIVAINKDENAPIFEIADYGLVADLFEALPELQAKI